MNSKFDLGDLDRLQREIVDPATKAVRIVHLLRRDHTLWMTVTDRLPGLFPTYQQRPLSREEVDYLLADFERYKAGGGRVGPREVVTRNLDDTDRRQACGIDLMASA